MNTRGLLDQLLKSGQDLLQQKAGGKSTGHAGGQSGGNLGSLLSGAGGGALAAGALGLLLGNKSARKLGGKALTYGGLAALGVLAYKAYGNWQAQQASATGAEPRTLDRLPAPQAEQHSQAILKALVAAAKADGHVDARERQLIEEELAKLTQDAELRRWLDAELNKPLVKTLVGMNMPAVAVTDQNNMCSLVKFYKNSMGAGIKPICGADLWLSNKDPENPVSRISLLAMNAVGYRNLTELISRGFIEGQRNGQVIMDGPLNQVVLGNQVQAPQVAEGAGHGS